METLGMETLGMTAVEDMRDVEDEGEARTAIDPAGIEMIEIVSGNHITVTPLEIVSANGIVKTLGGRTDHDRIKRRFRIEWTESLPRAGNRHHQSQPRPSPLPPS
jgi:hypothetical protein